MSAEPAAKKSRFDGPPEIKYTKIFINNEWHDSGWSLLMKPGFKWAVCVGEFVRSCRARLSFCVFSEALSSTEALHCS